jgi:DNA-binding SARP family transcriptional activator
MSSDTLEGGTAPWVPAPVDLDLLRGFQARRSGRVIDLPHAGQRLIAFLALHDRPLQRGYIAGTLWIDVSQEHAQAALRTTLWRIRQCARDLMACTAAGLALAGNVSVDLRRADECARRALRRRGAPQANDLIVLCDAGELLPDWYDDWLAIERERFRQLRLLALDALCEDLSATHRYGEAVVAGLASVAAEPLRESAHRVLIRAHLEAGNVGEALRNYRLFETLLRDQIGLDPSPGLRALVQAFER